MRNISGVALLRAAMLGMGAGAIAIAAMPAAAQTTNEGVNGMNAVSASFAAGVFSKGDDGRWHEYDSEGVQTYSFDETGRDEWSVYLNDPSRNVQLQIDLFRKMVGFGSNGGAKTDLYPITGSERLLAPTASVTGRTVSRVDFAQGRFVETAKGKWSEFGSNGSLTASFVETMRDDWSVYLNDPARNVQLQLDLHRKMVGYGSNGGAKSDLYKITASR